MTLQHIWETFEKAKNGFAGQGLLLSDIINTVKKAITSTTAIPCRDTLHLSPPKHPREPLGSLRVNVPVSLNTPVFLAGNPISPKEL